MLRSLNTYILVYICVLFFTLNEQINLHAIEFTHLTDEEKALIITKHRDTYRKLENASFVVFEKTANPANQGVLFKYDFAQGNAVSMRIRDHAKSADRFKILPKEMIYCMNKDYSFRLHKQSDDKPYVIQHSSRSNDDVLQFINNELSYSIYSFDTIIDRPLHKLLDDDRFNVTNVTHSIEKGKNVLRLDVLLKSTKKEEPSYTGYVVLDKDNDFGIVHLDVNVKFYEPNHKKDAVGRMVRDISYSQNALRVAVPSLVKISYVTNVYDKQETEWSISEPLLCDKPASAFRLPAFGLTDINKISSEQESYIPWFAYAAVIGMLCIITAWIIKRKRTQPA